LSTNQETKIQIAAKRSRIEEKTTQKQLKYAELMPHQEALLREFHLDPDLKENKTRISSKI